MDSHAATLITALLCLFLQMQPVIAADTDYLSRARANIDLELYGEAVVDCDEVLKSNPNSAEAYIIRAAANNKRREYQDAIEDADSCLKVDPKQARALVQRAIAHLGLLKPDEAIADCNNAISIDPNLENAHYYLGLAYQKAGQFDKSIEELTKALQLKHSDRRVYFARAWSKQQLDKDLEAVEDYDRAIKYYPPDDASQISLLPNPKFKAAAWVNPDLLRAVTIYDTAPKKGTDNTELLRSRGMAYLQMGKVGSAIRDFRAAIGSRKVGPIDQFPGIGSESDWQKAIPIYKEGLAKLGASDTKGAIIMFQQALKIFPQFPACLHSLAVASAQAGAGWQGEVCCIQAISYRPDDWRFWHTLGTILYQEYKMQIGDPTKRETAIAAFKNALSLKPPTEDDRGMVQAALHEASSSEIWQRSPKIGESSLTPLSEPDY
jgi:tetratricopeptide (TPR) repeat protein